MKRTDVAYIAGFFDGDGSVGAYWTANRRFPLVRVSFSNTDRDVLAWIREVFEVKASLYQVGEGRRSWQLNINRRSQVKEVLTAIGPHLRVRAFQVALAITLIDAIHARDEEAAARMADELSATKNKGFRAKGRAFAGRP